MDKAIVYKWEPELKSGEFGISEAVVKMAAQVIDTRDEMLVDVCKDAARKAGITDLTLIDRNSLIQYFAGMSERQKHCQFCKGDHVQTDDDIFDVQLSKVTPLPAINLTTGEKAESAEPPYHALIIGGDEGQDLMPIRFCPICGRELEDGKGKQEVVHENQT